MKKTGPHKTFNLAKAKVQDILKLARAGYTHSDIAEAVRVSRQVVQRVLAHPNPLSACRE